LLVAYKYRIYPTKEQKQKIQFTLERCRLLYNRLLEERILAYKQAGKTPNYYDQANTLGERKQRIPALKQVHSQVLQDVAKRLDKAYQAFFRRVKQGETAGFPRFKPQSRYDSFTYPQGGYTIHGNKVELSKIGEVKIKLHRERQGKIKTCTIITKNGNEGDTKMNSFVMLASFLGTSVEFIEALTIVLAVGIVKGWRTSLAGMAAAVAVLIVLVVIFGVPLLHLVHVFIFQFLVGLFMLLFGIRWLRKAILRYSGLKALHLEDQAFEEELAQQRAHQKSGKSIDAFGFATSFNGVFLEGLESIFIVITFGASAHALSSAVIGSLIGLLLVVFAGAMLRKPLSTIPENTMKFVVGIMLTGFGVFWVGEGIGVHWWREDLSIPVILVVLLFVSLLSTVFLKQALKKSAAVQAQKTAGGSL